MAEGVYNLFKRCDSLATDFVQRILECFQRLLYDYMIYGVKTTALPLQACSPHLRQVKIRMSNG